MKNPKKLVMLMIKPEDLIEKFKHALNHNWGYIWGTTGQVWTKVMQDAADRDMTKQYGSKWIGHNVADCSGLFTWAFKQLGSTMYHGSNTMFLKWTTASGVLSNGQRTDGKELLPGTAVFKYDTKYTNPYYHVGLYIGDNVVIEAQGTKAGVIASNLSAWNRWGELKDVDYGNSSVKTPSVGLGKAHVINGALNARNKASSTGSLVKRLPNGSEVEIIEVVDDNWVKITWLESAYVMSRYLESDI